MSQTGFTISDIVPCADLESVNIEGVIDEIDASVVERTLQGMGFTVRYVGSRSALVAHKEKVILIIYDSGRFTLSHIPGRSEGVELLRNILAGGDQEGEQA